MTYFPTLTLLKFTIPEKKDGTLCIYLNNEIINLSFPINISLIYFYLLCFGNATMLIHVDLARLFDLVVALFKKKSVFILIFLLKLVYVKCGPCYKFLCIYPSILYLASFLFNIK